MNRRDLHEIAVGVAFIAPNIAGFLVFTLFPLVFSLAMAFTNWDVRLHNIFTDESVRFVGLDNFSRLFHEKDFFKFLGNTLFFMLGIPFGVAGSLLAAILLSQELRHRSAAVSLRVLCCAGMIAGLAALVVTGAGATATAVLICGVAAMTLVGGAAGGRTVYRTLFYFPHFTAGVATFLLWKKLYSPHTGPINNAIRPLLTRLAESVNTAPDGAIRGLAWVCTIWIVAAIAVGTWRLIAYWREGEMGWLTVLLGGTCLCLPSVFADDWCANSATARPIVVAASIAAVLLVATLWRPRRFGCGFDTGLGHGLILSGAAMVAQFALIGLGSTFHYLPQWSAVGLNAPEWISNYHWAKPSIMLMGFWAAIGSNNMLLYLAGLSNIPTELYEAADIDGASRFQRFWHVTWPQLAPVTFFILVMATIGGLQGGFEMARTMTKGGPAGATTTLSYYVYTQGFEWGHLGYASAVAWTLFMLIFAVTLFNWKFGNRYVNE